MNRYKYLLENTMIIAIGNIGAKFIGFLMIPLYTYIFATKEYGILDLITITGVLIGPFLNLNIHEAVLRYALDNDSDPKKIFSIGLKIAIIGNLIFIFFIPIINNIEIIKEYALLVYFEFAIGSIYSIFHYFMRAIGKTKIYMMNNILLTFFNAGLNILLLVVFKLGIKGFLLAYIISHVLVILFIILVGKAYRYFNILIWDKHLAKEMIKYSIILVPNSLMWWIINSSDKYIVTMFLGLAANGLYAIAYKIPSILQIFSGIFIQSWQMSAVKENDSDCKVSFYQNIFNNLCVLNFILASLLIAYTKPIMSILVSQKFFGAWEYTPFLILAFMFGGLGSFLGINYMVAKKNIGTLYSAMIGCLINIILNFILIPKYGANGAAFATLCSYLSIFIFRYFDTQKFIKIKINFKRFLFSLAIIIGQIILLYININNILFYNTLLVFLIILINKQILLSLCKNAINLRK